MKLRIALAALLLTITVSVSVSGQNFRGIVRGLVTDSSAKPIASGRLTLIREETNERRQANTDARGGYAFTLLPPGNYRLEVEHSGFRKTVSALTLEVNQELRLDLALQIGTLTDEVRVEAPRSALRKSGNL